MDYLVCLCGVYPGLSSNLPLADLKDEDEAISQAREIAVKCKEGITVGLFTRDADAVCGWTVMKDSKLKDESLEVIQQTLHVGPGSFDLAERQAEEIRKARERKKTNE